MTHTEATCPECGPLSYAIEREGEWCCPWCGMPVVLEELWG